MEKLTLADHTPGSTSGSSSGYVTPLTEPSQAATLASTAQSSVSSAEGPGGPQENPSGHILTPFVKPDSSSKPNERPGLTPDQAAKYAEVHQAVSSWEAIPTSLGKNATSEPLSDDECLWLTRECLLRYLRATSWNVQNATKRLQETLVWRREYGLKDITADHVAPEAETGKQHILGYDNDMRPCLYMTPARQNTEKSERQIQHLVYMLERLIDMMPAGQETTALLINFKGATSGGSPSMNQGKLVLYILQAHYPERLGKACISDCECCFQHFQARWTLLTPITVPWYINTFFKLISPFIDPITKEKMVFNQDLRKYIPPVQLDKAVGGDADFEYKHDIYWPAMNKICAQRRAAAKDRWIRAGKQIGEYEAYLHGGSQQPLAELSKGGAVPVDGDNPANPARKVGE